MTDVRMTWGSKNFGREPDGHRALFDGPAVLVPGYGA